MFEPVRDAFVIFPKDDVIKISRIRHYAGEQSFIESIIHDLSVVFLMRIALADMKLSISPLKFPERLPWLSHAAFFL